SLREDQPLVVLATERVWSTFTANLIARTLARFEGHVRWTRLELGRETRVDFGAGEGLLVMPIPSPGKPPLHAADVTSHPEENVALRVREIGGRRSMLYASGVARATEELERE